MLCISNFEIELKFIDRDTQFHYHFERKSEQFDRI